MPDSDDAELRKFWTKSLNDFHQYTLTGFRMARLEVNDELVNVFVIKARHHATGEDLSFTIRIDEDFADPLAHSFHRLSEEIRFP